MAFKGDKAPWFDDPNPEAWKNLQQAAKAFRKHPDTIRRLAVTGTLRSYFDGARWWVRLEMSDTSDSSD